MEFNAKHFTAAQMSAMYRAAGSTDWANAWEVVASDEARSRIADRARERKIAAGAERITARLMGRS